MIEMDVMIVFVRDYVIVVGGREMKDDVEEKEREEEGLRGGF